MRGLEHLWNAEQLLRGEHSNPREALLAAASEFWKSVFYAPEWPDDLRRAAEDVYPYILLGGSIERTIAGLDDAGVEQASAAILRFCEHVRGWLPGADPPAA